jgi:predicted HicB family RNase H-like nuclease
MAKVDVVLDLDKDLLYELMLMAHERDITLNQLIETILTEYIKNEN